MTLAQTLQLPNLPDQPRPDIVGPLDPGKLPGPIGASGEVFTIGALLTRAIPFLLAGAGIGLLLMLVAGGFAYLTSAGDAKKLEQGKQQITNAIIGFLIIFCAYWLVQILGIIFGLDGVTAVFK